MSIQNFQSEYSSRNTKNKQKATLKANGASHRSIIPSLDYLPNQPVFQYLPPLKNPT